MNNLKISEILKELNYSTNVTDETSPLEYTSFESLFKTFTNVNASLKEDLTFIEIYEKLTKFEHSLIYRIWNSFCIDYDNHFSGIASLTWYKQVPPNSFDSWSFYNYQLFFKKFNELADKENNKNSDEQENSKIQQDEMMSSARRQSSSMMKSSSIPKAPQLRFPRLK